MVRSRVMPPRSAKFTDPQVIAGNTILFGVYGIVLLFVMGQRDLYLGLIREIGILRFAGRRTKRTMGAGLAEPQTSEQ